MTAPIPQSHAERRHVEPVVWLDGALRDPADAGLHWSDHGITVGDGVFETIKLVGDRPSPSTPHLDRLERSAAGLALELPPRPTIEAAVAAVAGTWWTAHGGDDRAGCGSP